jgi:hypothetical protein
MDATESLEKQKVFFESVYNCFLKAKAYAGEINYYYRICDTSVCLSFAGEALVRHITPAFSHLRISEIETPDLTICLWDSASTNTSMAPPPWKRDRYTYRGDIWGYNSSRIKTAFHWIEFSLNLLDIETNTGLFWVEHTESLPFWVNASPLRTLMHWWMEKNGCQLVHAAAIGTKNGAVMVTGKGGTGKSTTALSCLKAGFFYLGDDYIVTRLKPEAVAYSLYNTAKLNADHAENFSEFSRLISNPKASEGEKAVMFLYPEFGGQIIEAMPLKAVIVPCVTDRNESRVTKISFENVLRAASFTAMTQLPGAGIKTYEFFNQLSASLPCFNLELGRDLVHIPVMISDLLCTVSDENITEAFGRFTGEQRAIPRVWPVISVILPVFNGERFIREAVESIVSQGYPSLEIIILDDGSTDKTRDIVEQLPTEIRYFYQDNRGPAAARNKGVIEAMGEFIAFIDVDDLWPQNNLHMLVKELLQNKDIDVVHGYAQIAHYNDISCEYEYRGNPTESFPYYIGAALYRKSAFTRVGLFDSALVYGEDTDWFTRAKELNLNIKRLEDVTLIVRRHGKNMTCGKNMVELNHLRVFKKRLDRMRAQRRAGHVSS